MADSYSETPEVISLSGLNPSGTGYSGASQGAGGLSGDPYAKTPFGQTGGLGLAELLALFAQGGGGEVGAGGDILQSLSQGSLGQQTGGFGAGSFGQQSGQQSGQTSGGSGGQQYAAGQGSGSSADPLALASKFLGLAKTGIGIASRVQGDSAGIDLGTQADISGFTPEQQQAYQNYRQGERQDFTSSPFNMAGQSPFLTGETGLGPDANQIAGEMSGGYSGAPGSAIGGTGGLGANTTESFLGPGDSGGLSGSNVNNAGGLDYLGGGLGLLSGLASLYGGAQSGNAGAMLGGAGSALAGANQLFPGMGMGAAGSALGLVGGAANAPFAALNLYSAIDNGDAGGIAQGLASLYGTTVPVINSLFGTSLPTLTSLAGSALSSLGGTIGGSIGSALGSVGGALGGGVAGAGAGAASAAGASGAMGGASAAGASAAGAGAALPLAMITGPYVVAKLIQAYQAMGPDKANMRELGNRVSNIYGQLPGELSTLQGIPSITSQLSADSTPEQAASVLKQLNTMQDQYQAGGWESHQKSGLTRVKTVGDESGGGFSGAAAIPDVQAALDKMGPLFQLMDINRIRAQDVLGKAGWTPQMIQDQTGRYIGPQEWAMGLSGNTYTGAESGSRQTPEHAVYKDYNPTFNEQFRPSGGMPGHYEQSSVDSGEGGSYQSMNWVYDTPTAEQATMSTYAASPAGLTPGMGYTGTLGTPFGAVNRKMWDELAAIAPGNMEQGLMQYLQQYGGVNPGMIQMGFGQGFPQRAPQQMAPQTQQQPSVAQQLASPQQPLDLQSILAMANSPTASTATTMAPRGGMTEEETLMDALRRLGINTQAAYA